MTRLLPLISILLPLAACGDFGVRPTDVSVHVKDVDIPGVDCRPYPLPAPLALGDIEPQSRPDGWVISHEDYKELSDMWDATIVYMKQTRAIAKYFADCIEEYNRSLSELDGRRSAPENRQEQDRGNRKFRFPRIFNDLFR